ncbi:MAG: AtpZ/AtpI family protein [Parvularculales bacterium]
MPETRNPEMDNPSGVDNSDFDNRLHSALNTQGAQRVKSADVRPPASRRAVGTAFRLSSELVAGPVVGTAIGWFLDRWLNTAPLLIMIFFFLGVVAGILNVMRTAREVNQELSKDSQQDAVDSVKNAIPNKPRRGL